MGRPVNSNSPGDGYVSKRQFEESGSIAKSDFAVVADNDASKKIVLDPTLVATGKTHTIKSPTISSDVTTTLPSASGTLLTTGTESNAFGTIQPITGTSPVADSASATVTFKSSDSSIIIIGNSSTDEVDFKVASGASASIKIAHFRDQKTAGTDGGTFTSGAWQKRDITNLDDNNTGASLSSSQITLPAGTYFFWAQLPAFNIPNRHIGRLQNVTDSTTLIDGANCSHESSGPFTHALVSGIFTIAAQKVVEVQHRCQTTVNTIGYGRSVATTLSANYDIYTTGYFIKLA